MFSEMMKFRLLSQLRSKESIFWLLLFPIILSILFQAALSDITKGEKFNLVPVAVVDDETYYRDDIIPQIISSVSADTKKNVTEHTLFLTQYVSAGEAEELLDEEKIAGYIYAEDDGYYLVINENGVEQTIIKTFLDIALQKKQVLTDIAEQDSMKLSVVMSDLMKDSDDYIKNIDNRENEPDTSVVFFYSVLGMACMYGAATGCDAISKILAGQSAVAKRNNVAPVSKRKLFLSAFLVDMVINDILILLILSFIRFILGVNFGDRYALIVLTGVIGATTGLSFGYLFGSLSNKSSNFKSSIVIAISMVCSFLAGMMNSEVKYIVKQKAYIVDRLNPVNLITESFYKLYYYTSLESYFENIMILCAMTAAFIGGTILVLWLKNRNVSSERG